MGICGPLHARPNTLPAAEMYSRTTVPLPSVVSRRVYVADATEEEEVGEAVEPELADDALRMTATPLDGAGTVCVVALDPAGGVIGLPPSAALADSGTIRAGNEQKHPNAETTAARLKRINMVLHLAQSTADNPRNSRA